ncbi:MAG: hypothetical protein JSV25_16635 [Spirochaetota bacterium]|nr:MAG: hypothetical protein JSV25_16635 [Spirochaetota bacterium]
MIEKRGLFITILALVTGGLLSLWLYIRFRIIFFFLFIPIFTVGGSLFRNMWKGREQRYREPEGKEIDQNDYSVEDEE